MVKIIVTILQRGKKVKTAVGNLSETVNLSTLRDVWKAEQTLNNLPCDLRFHINIEEGEDGK